MRVPALVALLFVSVLGRGALAGAEGPTSRPGPEPPMAAATTTPPASGTGATSAGQPSSGAAAPAVEGPIAPATGGRPAGASTGATFRQRFPRLQPPSLIHANQFGVAVMPGSGFRVIAPYQDMAPCGQQNKRVCNGALPFFIDVQPSFGFARHWDALVDLRFGVVADFSQSHEFAVAPGVRYWVDPELPTKFFATVQGVYELNPQHQPGIKDYDLAVRNANGLMIEVMRNLGFYLQVGETLGFVRWLRFEIDGGIGVQARFP